MKAMLKFLLLLLTYTLFELPCTRADENQLSAVEPLPGGCSLVRMGEGGLQCAPAHSLPVLKGGEKRGTAGLLVCLLN